MPFRLVIIKGEKSRIKFLQALEGAEAGLGYVPENKTFIKWIFSPLASVQNS